MTAHVSAFLKSKALLCLTDLLKIAKRLAIISFALLLLSAIYLAGYGFLTISPHIEEIAQMAAAEPEPPRELYLLAISDASQDRIGIYTARLLGWRYHPNSRIANWYWAYIIPRIFSQHDMFKIWVRIAPCAHGFSPGLRIAAQVYYDKELNELDRRQLAALVVATRSPSLFRPGGERSIQRVEQLLAK